MRRSMLALMSLAACGGEPTRVEGSSESDSVGTDSTESGDAGCPELVWMEPSDGRGLYLDVETPDQAAALPPYTRVEGGLRIDSPEITNLEFLSCLEEVGGLSIGAPDLESLHGLERLRVVAPMGEHGGGSLSITGTPLRTLEGIDNLESIGQDLDIKDNPNLESLAAFASLREVEVIDIDHNPSLLAVDFPALERFHEMAVGDLDCSGPDGMLTNPLPDGSPSLVEIDLPNLQTYTWLRIQGNPQLASIESLHGPMGFSATIELNPMLPYEQVEALAAYLDEPTENLLDSCGNLGDPNVCICEELPP